MQCQVMAQLFDVIRQLRAEEYIPHDLGAGTPLYHAEVGLLEAIARYPEESCGALASHLGVTGGALAQTAKKLVAKGLVEQYDAPHSRKVRYHRLTPAGEAALAGHAAYHHEAGTRMRSYLCALPPAERATISSFLGALGKCMPLCAFDCEHNPAPCRASSRPEGRETAVRQGP